MTAPVITRIELTAFEVRIPDVGADPIGYGLWYEPGPGTAQARLAVRVHTRDGPVGEYVAPRARVKVIMAAAEALAHLLVGQPALARERHYQTMRRATKHVGEAGIGALDIALWDLAGKHHGASVATLLGGHRSRLPAYASTIWGDRHARGLSSPEAYADFAERCLALGYRGYKMHGWKESDPAEESAMIRAVAERVAGRMDVMYDAAGHLATLTDAIRVGRVCDEHGLLWLEDPYADGGLTVRGHRALKEKVRTPIMIGEFVRSPEVHTELLIAGASDFGRVDPDYDGGITGCYKAALAAEMLGIDVEVHSCGPPMRHLMAALARSNYYEVNLVHPMAPNPWDLPVYADDYTDALECVAEDGCVPVPVGPGLGVEYDWKVIESQALERRVVE
jgi:L-alanine-DL-glutamate epimerase-like enolase superfamily enzyme